MPDPEQVADGVNEIGAVQSVEVKLRDAAGDKVHDLFGRHRSRNKLRCLRIFHQAIKPLGHLGWNRSPAAGGEARHLLEIVDWD